MKHADPQIRKVRYREVIPILGTFGLALALLVVMYIRLADLHAWELQDAEIDRAKEQEVLEKLNVILSRMEARENKHVLP